MTFDQCRCQLTRAIARLKQLIYSMVFSAIGDATGRANLSWTATSTDAASPKCGHDSTLGVGNDSAVNVHADSSCSA
jgi:hypothetical protein